jgi:hypothetical protein
MAPWMVDLVRGVVQLSSTRADCNPSTPHSMTRGPAPVATSTDPGVVASHVPLSFVAVHFTPTRFSGHLCSLVPGNVGALTTHIMASRCSRW